MNVRRPNIKVLDENIAQVFVVILARMHRDMFAVLVKDLHHEA